MAYEKKNEPLTPLDSMMAGITLLLWLLILHILPWGNSSTSCIEEIIKLDVSSEEDVETFHNCVKDHKSMFLTGATLLLAGYPIVLSHIYYSHRLFNTLWSCYNINLFECIYYGSWLIISAVYCVIIPAITILFVYYDWEFAQGYKYQGYAIQFQFGHFWLILLDCVTIPFGCAASSPWFTFISIIVGLNKSSYWEISKINRIKSVSILFSCMSCMSCNKILLLLICIIMGCISLFGSFITAFDYSKNGYFSYHGDSQWFFIIIYLSWLIIGITGIYIGCNLDKIENFMNNSVKPIPLNKTANLEDVEDNGQVKSDIDPSASQQDVEADV